MSRIPEQALEAATTALHRYDLEAGLSGYLKPSSFHMAEARAAVHAAAPMLAAEVIRDAANDLVRVITEGGDPADLVLAWTNKAQQMEVPE